ncbi:MAG: AAA family ATPase [Actinomycetota bacterium]|nr:AAA family ATPase [Actinomycetota bacterium]
MELLSRRILSWSAELPAWQRDALRRAARGGLTGEDHEALADMLLQTAGASEPQPLDASHLPAEDRAGSPVSLLRIKNAEGINALAARQTLQFEPGLNVVYGNNGSGKSGFGRLLRYACRAVSVPDILPNAFAPPPKAQQALVVVRRGEEEKKILVDLRREPDRFLSSMRVFDAECAETYVRTGNAIEHTPEPLGVLTRCARGQTEISDLLRERRATAEARLSPLPVVPESTSTALALRELSADTDPEALLRRLAMNADEQRRLAELESRLQALNSDRVDELQQEARHAAAGAESLATLLEMLADKLGASAAVAISGAQNNLTEAQADLERLRTEVLGGQRVPGTGTDAWRTMWEAARAFVRTAAVEGAHEHGGDLFGEHAGSFPPTQPDPCPLCQRGVDAATEKRLAEFERFVTSDLEARVQRATREVEATLTALPAPEDHKAAATSELAALDEALRADVLECFSRLETRRAALIGGAELPPADVQSVCRALRQRGSDATRRADQLANLRQPEKRRELVAQIDDLRGRRDAVAAADAIRRRVAELAFIHRLDTAISALNTAGITRKYNELAKLAITDKLVAAIDRELQALGSLSDRVEVRAGGSRGRTVLRVQLKGGSKRPADVLSEGEHRAVALSFFLGELAVAGGSSTIIFDDPVSSLDHVWRDEIAARLVSEASRRQVVIFTHDLAFLYQLAAGAESEGVRVTQSYLRRDERGPGVVTNEPPIKQVTLQKRAEELRRRVDQNLQPLWEHNRDVYERKADEWMTDLRKSWEMLVEDGLFKGVIKRLDARLHRHRLKYVAIPPHAADRVTSAFGRLSAKAHHEAAAAAASAPSPARLLELLEDFESFANEVAPAKDQDAADEGSAAA